MNHYSYIKLEGLMLNVFLGWPVKERADQQMVSIDVTLHFPEIPLACTTDQLNDTQCYDYIASLIKKTVENRTFKLIEYLGYEIYQAIKPTLSPTTKLHIKISKQPNIANLTKGVVFCLGEKE